MGEVVTSATTVAKPRITYRQRLDVRRRIPIQLIADALIKSGYTSLDSQAKALGLHRATVWTIMRNKHKLGRLNTKTARCILANPDTPVLVRSIIQAMLSPKNRTDASDENKSRPKKV